MMWPGYLCVTENARNNSDMVLLESEMQVVFEISAFIFSSGLKYDVGWGGARRGFSVFWRPHYGWWDMAE